MLNNQLSSAPLERSRWSGQSPSWTPTKSNYTPAAAATQNLESPDSTPITPLIHADTRIKWGYALAQVADLPSTWAQATGRVRMETTSPRRNDVLIAQIVAIGRHRRLDLMSLGKSMLLEDDLVGLAFSPRYATRQFEAIVPPSLEEVHFICAGGVCGQVVGAPNNMTEPTLLRPLGYLLDSTGRRVNLRDHALEAASAPTDGIDIIVIVGASMDSGKTTTAYSLVNGLARGGHRAAAAKITGTASAKDPIVLRDAGATRVLDFTNAGFASTCGLGADELWTIADTLISQLARDKPGAIILEIADGVTQRETVMLLEMLTRNSALRGVIYTCNDSLGVASGVSRLREQGLSLLAVSGTVTSSALSIREAQRETDLPVLSRDDLRSPDIAQRIGLCGHRRATALDCGAL